MNPEKAIKDLQARVDGEFAIEGEDDCADIKLGIEALNRVRSLRLNGKPDRYSILPGETKD